MSTPPPNPYGQPHPPYQPPQQSQPYQPQPPYGYPPNQPTPPPPTPGYGPPPAYGQQPPSYGYPAPVPPPPGYGPPQYAPTPPPPPPVPTPGPAPAPAKPPRSLRQKLRLVGAAGGVVVLIAGFFLSGSDPARAKVGDCVDAVGTNDVNKIACTDPKADYVVLSKASGTSDVSRCRQTPGATSTFWSSTGRRWHRTKYVLCLGPVHVGSPVAKPS